MKATEQYFPVVLFIMLHKMALTFESVGEIVRCCHSNEFKATEKNLPAVLFILLYKMVLTFESVGKILKCDHSNKRHWAEIYQTLPCFVFTMLYKVTLRASPNVKCLAFKQHQTFFGDQPFYRLATLFGAL